MLRQCCCRRGERAFGVRTLGFWASTSLLFNAIVNIGLFRTGAMFGRAGWLIPCMVLTVMVRSR